MGREVQRERIMVFIQIIWGLTNEANIGIVAKINHDLAKLSRDKSYYFSWLASKLRMC